jgi:hypothetical protein
MTDESPGETIIDFTPADDAGVASEDALARELEANRDLLERLRLALLASEPAIDPALVRGTTADEVEASFAAARNVITAVREEVRREQAGSIPAGAPGRDQTGPRTSFEKIRSGLSRLGSN